MSIVLCACGCGRPAPIATSTSRKLGFERGKPRRFIKGHNVARKDSVTGYRRKNTPSHPRYRYGSVPEHVLIAERALGRILPHGAVVHHVDQNKTNNLPRNLVICQSSQYHMLIHARMRIITAGGNPNTDLICSLCRAVKPATCFSPVKPKWNRASGRSNTCSSCAAERARTHRANRRQSCA